MRMTRSDVRPRIVDASVPEWVETARTLIAEYADWLNVDRCLRGFSKELASLPGDYAPPRGRLLLAVVGEEPAGVVAMRSYSGSIGEVKRLWVRPPFRGAGIGRVLIERLILEAVGEGYRTLVLDTLTRMVEAANLYRSLGFEECAPDGAQPGPGVICMALELHPPDAKAVEL